MKGEMLEGSLLAAGTVVAVALFGEDLFLSVYEFVDFWTQVIKEWHE